MFRQGCSADGSVHWPHITVGAKWAPHAVLSTDSRPPRRPSSSYTGHNPRSSRPGCRASPALTMGSTASGPPCPVHVRARTGCTGRPHRATSCLAGCRQKRCKQEVADPRKAGARGAFQKASQARAATNGDIRAAPCPKPGCCLTRACIPCHRHHWPRGRSRPGGSKQHRWRTCVKNGRLLDLMLPNSVCTLHTKGSLKVLTWQEGQVCTPGSLLAVPSGQSTHESCAAVGMVPGPHS